MSANFEAIFAKWPFLKKTVDTGIESNDGREEDLLNFVLNHPNIREIKGSPARLLSAIDEFAHTKDFLISIGEHKAQVVSNYVRKQKPKVTVELGGYLGYSAILIADTLRKALPNERFQVWSLELEPKFATMAERLIDIAGLSEYVSVVVGPSEKTLGQLQNQGEVRKIDLLFLDHVEKLYKPDFLVCKSLGLFKEGTLIIADNVVLPGALEYREFVRSDPGLSSVGVRGLIQPGDLEDELEITYVKSAGLESKES